ncbi:MAG: DNA-directed polymerase subunit omega [Clostridia bacterium]|jgi:DNA-directed RNA polymerase subunit omega|nr:rpoZ [Clostridiales bacterium]MDK2985977.1 DNA-directed polymerase subunit omega [Clostridia bacterium]
MKQPSIDKLLEVVDNKYALVVIAAKRARKITDEILSSEEKAQKYTSKPVTEALLEIGEGKVKFKAPTPKKLA